MNVAVYCGSQLGKNSKYAETASELGKVLADQRIGIVYGGSNTGLMGKLADAALAQGGRVIGVMPGHLSNGEKVHLNLTDIHIVDSMHIRKQKMVNLADAFIALPGGCGTMDEYFEVFTWAQINPHSKPVILYNIDGFYDALILHFERMLADGFIRPEQRSILKVADSIESVFSHLPK